MITFITRLAVNVTSINVKRYALFFVFGLLKIILHSPSTSQYILVVRKSPLDDFVPLTQCVTEFSGVFETGTTIMIRITIQNKYNKTNDIIVPGNESITKYSYNALGCSELCNIAVLKTVEYRKMCFIFHDDCDSARHISLWLFGCHWLLSRYGSRLVRWTVISGSLFNLKLPSHGYNGFGIINYNSD